LIMTRYIVNTILIVIGVISACLVDNDNFVGNISMIILGGCILLGFLVNREYIKQANKD